MEAGREGSRGLWAVAQAWKPSSQHAGEKRGVAGLLLGRTERAARQLAEGLGPHCMQTTKAYRKESSVRGKRSAPGCVTKLLLGNADSAVNGGPHCRQILYHLSHQGSPVWQALSETCTWGQCSLSCKQIRLVLATDIF